MVARAIAAAARGYRAYTQALMDLGATVCTRATPRCGECPVAVGLRGAAHGPRRGTARRRVPSRRGRRAQFACCCMERAGAHPSRKASRRRDLGRVVEPPRNRSRGRRRAPLQGAISRQRHRRRRARSDRARLHALPADDASAACRGAEVAAARGSAGLLWLTRDDALAAALPAPIRKLLRHLS